MNIHGLKAALNSRNRFKYKPPESVIDHLVVGGGVVGLAVARTLTLRYSDKSTILVERNPHAGEETSSRNSEVIHAGLYYPPGSLKESLCIRGRDLLYDYCEASSVPYRRTGKLVVAQKHQRDYIEALHKKTSNMSWSSIPFSNGKNNSKPVIPTELISGDEARALEPDLSPSIDAALLSRETGIIDSHTFMESLERDILETSNGDLVYSTSVVRVDPYTHSRLANGIPDIDAKEDGWVVQMVTQNPTETDPTSAEGDSFLARTLINASGLSGTLILNSLFSRDLRIPMYYARGSYAAYNGTGVKQVSHLIYPCPDTGKKNEHSFQSLGTHLTLDLSGNIKFGPDIQWISPSGASKPGAGPTTSQSTLDQRESFSFDENDIDFWKQHLVADESQLSAMFEAVRSYLPGVEQSKFRPDYVGIRPKLVPPWGGFQDFVFRQDLSTDFLRTTPINPRKAGRMISLLGIESPGLTASLAIAERVVSMLESQS